MPATRIATLFLTAFLFTLPAHGRVAGIWYITFDPIDVLGGLTTGPQDVVAFDPGTGTVSAFASIADTPLEVDGFERVDDDTFYFSLDTHANLDGTVIAPGDIVLSDGGNLSLAFDASAAGLPDGVDVDAVTRAASGDLVFSVDTHVQLSGTLFEDADLIGFDGSSFSMVLDASAIGFDDATDIDAATRFSDDRFAISAKAPGSAGGFSYDDGTLLLVQSARGVISVELDASDDPGTSSDIVALSATQVGELIFEDSFEST